MTKIPEAEARLFHRKWVCRKCKKVMKADNVKVRGREIVCRGCQNRDFKAKKKEKRAIK